MDNQTLDEIRELVALWKSFKWWQFTRRRQIAHIVMVKLAYRTDPARYTTGMSENGIG